MRKILIHSSGRQTIVENNGNFVDRFSVRKHKQVDEIVEQYEIQVPDEQFGEMMEHPNKIKAKDIKNKRRIG